MAGCTVDHRSGKMTLGGLAPLLMQVSLWVYFSQYASGERKGLPGHFTKH